MNISNETTFRTADTALAAYIISRGLGAPTLEFGNGSVKATFVFQKDNSQIMSAIEAWDSVCAEGNCVTFFQAYQSLLRRVRERY